MTTWRKSSRSSGSQQGGCIEVAVGEGRTLVRDSKDPSGPVLRFSGAAWGTFLDAIRADEAVQRHDHMA
ncbi:DUF397 domain-containing protein [Spirillospora sp. NPDC127200]